MQRMYTLFFYAKFFRKRSIKTSATICYWIFIAWQNVELYSILLIKQICQLSWHLYRRKTARDTRSYPNGRKFIWFFICSLYFLYSSIFLIFSFLALHRWFACVRAPLFRFHMKTAMLISYCIFKFTFIWRGVKQSTQRIL